MSNLPDLNTCTEWLIYINESTVPGQFAFVPFVMQEESHEPGTFSALIVRGAFPHVEGSVVKGLLVDEPYDEAMLNTWFNANNDYLEAFGL